ncbi:MAG: hypothetical protein ACREVK_13730, partial [Gammaproteobacteria bacterium]
MTAASKSGFLLKLHDTGDRVCRTRQNWGEAVVSWEEASKCTRGLHLGLGVQAPTQGLRGMPG